MRHALTLQIVRGAVEQLLSGLEERVLDRLAERTDQRPWLSSSDAAEYLRVPRKTIYNWTSAGSIPHRKIGQRLLFHRVELDAWVDRYREGRPC